MNHESQRESAIPGPFGPGDARADAVLAHLQQLLQSAGELPSEDTPLGKLAAEFFSNTWATAADGLLKRTNKIRLRPEHSPAPRAFEFDIDTPYKRKLGSDASVELMPGPVLGRIMYRADLFENLVGPTVLVLIDPSLGYFHPNYDRDRGVLCIGAEEDLPPGPLPLDNLIENHLYPIITYQNRRPSHPLDQEAARFFAIDPTAMDGLEPAAPLY